MANRCVIARHQNGAHAHNEQSASRRTEAYPSTMLRAGRWGVEIECFLPERAVNELGISIGSYPFGRLRASHHGRPLPSPAEQPRFTEGLPVLVWGLDA